MNFLSTSLRLAHACRNLREHCALVARGAMGIGFAGLLFYLNLSFVAVITVLLMVVNCMMTLGGWVWVSNNH